MTFGNMQETNMFYSLESSLLEMRDLQPKNPQGEETPFIGPEEEEEIENEENSAFEETKAKRQEKNEEHVC